jgi:hypothetical protein
LESATGQPLHANFSADVESLGANLLGCYTQGLVSLHTYQPQLATTVSERPFASPVARLLAEERAENLTNLRHERVTLDRLDHYLLRRLDGTRDLSDLLQAVLTDPMADDDPSKVEPADSSSLAETERKEDVIERKLRFRLAWLARTGLLVH